MTIPEAGAQLYRYEIRHLDELPWPQGLGKLDNRDLQAAMQAHLGDRWGDPRANERAFHHDPKYREIAQFWLEQMDFAADLTDVVSQATSLAANLQLLNCDVTQSEWQAGVTAFCEESGIDPRWTGPDGWLVRYLDNPIALSPYPDAACSDGRHRITWLRLRHRDGTGPSDLLVAQMLPER